MKKRRWGWGESPYVDLADLPLGEGCKLVVEEYAGTMWVHFRIRFVPGDIIMSHTFASRAWVEQYGWKQLREVAVSTLSRLKGRGAAAAAAKGKIDPGSKKRYPGLVDLLTLEKDDDGESREPASLGVKWQEGCIRVVIHEPNLEMSLWATADTLERALDCLEARLQSEDADWRAWTGGAKKPSKKR